MARATFPFALKPPADLPSTLVALGEAYARRAGIAPGDFWAYLYRKAAPPAELRAAIVDAFYPLVRPDDFLGLTALATNATLATSMSTEPTADTRETRVSRARLAKGNRRHAFVAALVEAGITVTEAAKALGYPRSTVQSWYDADEDNARPAPKKAVDALAAGVRIGDRVLKVPASAWRRTTE